RPPRRRAERLRRRCRGGRGEGSVTSWWEATRPVAAREPRQAARSKGPGATAIVLLLGSAAATVLPDLHADDDRDRYDVAIVAGDATIELDALESVIVQIVDAIDADVELSQAPDVDAARQQVLDEDVDVAVALDERPVI